MYVLSLAYFAQLAGANIPKAELDESTIQGWVEFLIQFAAILALIYVLIGAIRLTVSAGDPQQVASGRKTLIYSLVGLGISVMGMVITSYVQALGARAAGETTNPFFGTNGVLTILVSQLGFVVGVASVIMVILGGFRYITSAGQPQSAQAARNTIVYAIVGVVVALAAQAIVSFVLEKL
jgi:hypothetical protein